LEKEISNQDGMVDTKFIPVKQDHHLVDSIFIRSLHIEKLINCICNPLEKGFFV